MNNIVGFGFKGNISAMVIKKLRLHSSFTVNSNYNDLDLFLQKLINMQPKLILGLGMYSRKDKDKLRVETLCKLDNKCYAINYFLQPLSKSKLANGIGKSYCNYISGRIMEKIMSQELNAQYTFIHIPKSFAVSEAVKEIEAMISNSRS